LPFRRIFRRGSADAVEVPAESIQRVSPGILRVGEKFCQYAKGKCLAIMTLIV
jgi:hypothetical protein